MTNPSRRRRRTLLFAGISAAVVSAAVIFVVMTTVSSGGALEYFKSVDEVAKDAPAWKGRRVRLHGNVVSGTIQKKRESMDYRFAVHRGNRWVEVTYTGLVPDTFKDCAEVVVTGQLRPDGKIFAAESIAGKCPSKYDQNQRATGCGEGMKADVLAQRTR
ncbi:MAG: cytochrome c maturation protein CcmE [Deltaproteobacteria bacterium]|nr:cytochrome c maturation protein CcmE [Deltaproteobacteria bacterium]